MISHTHTHFPAPVCASLCAESGLQQLVAGLGRELRAASVRTLHRSTALGEADSYTELLHTLDSLAESYQARFCPDDSTDSD